MARQAVRKAPQRQTLREETERREARSDVCRVSNGDRRLKTSP